MASDTLPSNTRASAEYTFTYTQHNTHTSSQADTQTREKEGALYLSEEAESSREKGCGQQFPR